MLSCLGLTMKILMLSNLNALEKLVLIPKLNIPVLWIYFQYPGLDHSGLVRKTEPPSCMPRISCLIWKLRLAQFCLWLVKILTVKLQLREEKLSHHHPHYCLWNIGNDIKGISCRLSVKSYVGKGSGGSQGKWRLPRRLQEAPQSLDSSCLGKLVTKE